MTLLETLQAHKGGLLQIKSQLFWYDGRGWDKSPGRICLILDSAADFPSARLRATASALPAANEPSVDAALLLIDGLPRWVWVDEANVEVIDEAG